MSIAIKIMSSKITYEMWALLFGPPVWPLDLHFPHLWNHKRKKYIMYLYMWYLLLGVVVRNYNIRIMVYIKYWVSCVGIFSVWFMVVVSFAASRTLRNKFLLFKTFSLLLYYFVMGAQADKCRQPSAWFFWFSLILCELLLVLIECFLL